MTQPAAAGAFVPAPDGGRSHSSEPARDFPPGPPIVNAPVVNAPVVNAMSVDVEDYFQVQALSSRIARGDWETMPCRVEGNVDRLLALFAGAGVKATFFTLGWIAERYPTMVRRIVDEGHELASHGWDHTRADSQDEVAFRADVRKTKRRLEQIGGVPVIGYRAATFSIGPKNMWALKVLEEEGYRYSSSLYPIRHDLYGDAGGSRAPYHPGGGAILEAPMTTARWFGRNFPCSGGGYFRLLPYSVSRFNMRRVNRHDRMACIFYFHPWEIDPGQPKQDGLSAKARFRHYTNLDRMEGRLRRLLADFAWDRMDRVFLDGR